MRRGLVRLCACILTLLFVLTPATGLADSGITVDGKPLVLDTPPVNKHGILMVPMRPILEALGAEIRWDPKTQTVKATHADSGITILLTVGAADALVNGLKKGLYWRAEVIDGRTMVPLRFISEALGSTVTWDAATKSVRISKPTPRPDLDSPMRQAAFLHWLDDLLNGPYCRNNTPEIYYDNHQYADGKVAAHSTAECVRKMITLLDSRTPPPSMKKLYTAILDLLNYTAELQDKIAELFDRLQQGEVLRAEDIALFTTETNDFDLRFYAARDEFTAAHARVTNLFNGSLPVIDPPTIAEVQANPFAAEFAEDILLSNGEHLRADEGDGYLELRETLVQDVYTFIAHPDELAEEAMSLVEKTPDDIIQACAAWKGQIGKEAYYAEGSYEQGDTVVFPLTTGQNLVVKLYGGEFRPGRNRISISHYVGSCEVGGTIPKGALYFH